MNFYENCGIAQQFMDFLETENGRVQKQILQEAIFKYLPNQPQGAALDAACGNGWLASALTNRFARVEAFDSSEPLISRARLAFPKINFLVADACSALPYPNSAFDCSVLNMASHDLENQPAAFANLYRTLKPGGKLIITLANPYYAYPVGVWKRGWLRALLFKKAVLKLRPYHFFSRSKNRSFRWNGKLMSRFYPLSEQINNLLQCGFQLTAYEDLASPQDSETFNAAYQLHRFPTLLLLTFKKTAE